MTPQRGTIVVLALLPPDTQVFILNDSFLDFMEFTPVQKVMKLLKEMHVDSFSTSFNNTYLPSISYSSDCRGTT